MSGVVAIATVATIVVVVAIVLIVIIVVDNLPQYVVIQSANTKENWMNEMATQFNSLGLQSSTGKPMYVQIEHTGSTFKPELEPAAWSPGIGSWISITNGEYGGNLITDENCQPTVQIPIGVAMWKPMAELLGWPNSDITWEELSQLASDEDGWATYGGSYGKFKYGHGHPEFSNSGRLSIVAQVHAYSNNSGFLSVNDVNNQLVQDEIKALQDSIVHYGRLDTDLLDRMTTRGPDYLHGVTTYESNVIRWNEEKNLLFPFVLVYPKDGIFWNDHPICILDGTSAIWNNAHEIEVATAFRDFILTEESQEETVRHGVRPAEGNINIETITGSKITQANGVIPTLNIETIPTLPLPDQNIVTSVIDMWKLNKKPATMVMIIDVSGSMAGDKIRSAIIGARNFLDELNPKDDIVIYKFNDDVEMLNSSPENTNVGQYRSYLQSQITNLRAGQTTALYDACSIGLQEIDRRKTENIARDYSSTYGIILLSDGDDTASSLSESQLMSSLPSSEDSSGVHVYSIAYGEGVSYARSFLQDFSARTNGLYFEADTTDIEEIYVYITSEF